MSENITGILGSGVKVPVHVGVIMDGNGRWLKKSYARRFGHRRALKISGE